ncbi:phospholipase A1-like [Eupeodes corollae]|uniref:phospholipase A1-like n=1 Tax=Eupeodes corollae TaxID=290404 RepID=UPI0024910832|nr:phospholipase A1-like [Eupeodes corollae]XP_055915931.1 phospholipase A1-like [Eupeodes corollae]
MGKNIMRLIQIGALALIILQLVHCETDSSSGEDDTCVHNLGSTKKHFYEKIPGIKFIGKAVKSMIKPQKEIISFYLYKRDFPTCAQEIRLDDDSLHNSGFDASHPTRIIINGWMSSSRNPFIRSVSSAYFSIQDYNIIVVDWSSISTSINYYKVAKLIDKVGAKVADFARHLHKNLLIDYDDIYLIGHSLGAQVAGSAGKNLHPDKFNTIFALDPAGPSFKEKGIEGRLDSSDAKYVESIQTSENMGFLEPLGHATFYPNKGSYQNCMGYGCSHRRAYKYFAESINSTVGFWGVLCDKEQMKSECPEGLKQYKMGGEPSTPKVGVFYVKTNNNKPYARGKSDSYLYS